MLHVTFYNRRRTNSKELSNNNITFHSQDYDSSSHFGDSTTQSAKPESLTIKLKADKQEIEEFYITVSN